MNNLITNWKTTLGGVIAGLIQILALLFPKTFTPAIADAISVLALAFGLGAAKDGSPSIVLPPKAIAIEQAAAPLVSELTSNSNNKLVEVIHVLATTLASQQTNAAPVVATPATAVNAAAGPETPAAASSSTVSE